MIRRILGVDPGTWRTGAGVLEVAGNDYRLIHAEVITVTQALPVEQRLLIIYRSLRLIVQEHRPEVLALESIFYHKDIQAMIKLGEARACAMLAASEQGLPVVEYHSTRVKQAVTGSGRASKEQVELMLRRLLGFREPLALDASDALAVAVCHAHLKKHAEPAGLAGGKPAWFKKQMQAVLAARPVKTTVPKQVLNHVPVSFRKTR